ncbi:FAD-binding oxidoreductase [Actinacidiphila guanduensis]|uniref:FAD/FMN-containing dehydrogenase n=1 Tax=Actinacidiphila guanduensis TaxID=310781 RepID=A0A1H0S0Q5_9ACTN|nr:FAD-binding oxidoreductase [Actinacidiphila guanduensis]SDP35330.1 FAD/FMN-containing dehydrogenase [Actinacidiphila guanduensis]
MSDLSHEFSGSEFRTGVTELQGRVRGPVLLPGDHGFVEECTAYNLLRTLRPVLVVGATDAGDVAAAVRFAADHGMPVAIKNRGHQMVLPDADRTLLITTHRLSGIAVNPEARTVRVGAGVRWSEVLPIAARHGLAPLAGSAPGVGVVGYTLGGGLSPLLGRSAGYAADHVRSMDVIMADGTARTVTPENDPDLYWALLGGKGNFAVVTAIEFGALPVTRFYGGGLWLPGERAKHVLSLWRTWQEELGRESTTSVAVQRLPELPTLPEPLRGAFVLHVRFAHLGDAAQGAALIAPLRAAATPLLDTLAERPYEQLGEIHLDPPAPLPYVEGSLGLRTFGADTLAAFTELTGPESDCPLVTVELRALGGALDEEPAVPNAVASRGLPFVTFAFGVGGPDEVAPMEEHLKSYVHALSPWADDRNVTNFVGPDDATTPADVRRHYGADRYARLSVLKRRYDPDNVFRVNHNIPPAS